MEGYFARDLTIELFPHFAAKFTGIKWIAQRKILKFASARPHVEITYSRDILAAHESFILTPLVHDDVLPVLPSLTTALLADFQQVPQALHM